MEWYGSINICQHCFGDSLMPELMLIELSSTEPTGTNIREFLDQNSNFPNDKNAVENVVCEPLAILFWSQCVRYGMICRDDHNRIKHNLIAFRFNRYLNRIKNDIYRMRIILPRTRTQYVQRIASNQWLFVSVKPCWCRLTSIGIPIYIYIYMKDGLHAETWPKSFLPTPV